MTTIKHLGVLIAIFSQQKSVTERQYLARGATRTLIAFTYSSNTKATAASVCPGAEPDSQPPGTNIRRCRMLLPATLATMLMRWSDDKLISNLHFRVPPTKVNEYCGSRHHRFFPVKQQKAKSSKVAENVFITKIPRRGF